jgi:creatinine amidohydrolase
MTMNQNGHPLCLKDLTAAAVRGLVAARPWLIIPVGTLEGHAPHLPLGVIGALVERLADDLSARFRVVRSPLISFGVNRPDTLCLPGSAGLQRKTLHRVMNELIASWEASAGIEEFVILSAQAYDPHLEALGTILPLKARLQVVDLATYDPAEFAGTPAGSITPLAGETSLALYLAGGQVWQDQNVTIPVGATAEVGQRIYTFMLDRVASRCFPFSPGTA